jgi:hypothetical protein
MKKILMITLVGIALHVQAQKNISQEEILEVKKMIVNMCELMFTLQGVDEGLDCACKVIADVSIDIILEKYGDKDMKNADWEKYYVELNDPNSQFHNEFVSLLEAEFKAKCKVISTATIEVNGPAAASIPLLKYGNMYKIKMELAGSSKYYIMDSGASMSVISKSYATELAKLKFITKHSYMGEMPFELADGSSVVARIIQLNNVKIGTFTLNNVLFAIINDDDINFLFGKNILDAFQSWNIDNNKVTLELIK